MVEDLAQFLRIDARAAVEYAQHHVGRVGVAGHRRCHLDLVTTVAQGVLDEVDQQALDRHSTQRQQRHRLHAETDALALLVVGRHHLADQLTQVDLLDRLVAAIAHEGEELVEDGVHVFDVSHHLLGELFVARHQLQRQAQAGQRRTQVVRHAGQHQFAFAPGLLDVFGHLIEGAVDLGHLARCVADRQPHAAALADLPGRVDQALERQIELLTKIHAAPVDSSPIPRNQPSTLQIRCPRSG